MIEVHWHEVMNRRQKQSIQQVRLEKIFISMKRKGKRFFFRFSLEFEVTQKMGLQSNFSHQQSNPNGNKVSYPNSSSEQQISSNVDQRNAGAQVFFFFLLFDGRKTFVL